jgi:phage tail-like protein
MSKEPVPLHVFNFAVEFHQVDDKGKDKSAAALCSGRFSEISGLEASMEPKVVRAGGRNWGEIQRPGLVKFATVILKRGVTRAPDLWTWFDLVARQGRTAVRLRAEVIQFDAGRREVLRWKMQNALPVKFKAATYVAASSEIGVEELHFVHEDLTLKMAGGAA